MGEAALEYFDLMVNRNVEPNEVTLFAVLFACSHAGLIDQGRAYFARMSRDFSIDPKIEHYGCMVEMLGRAGLVEDTHDLIVGMSFEPNEVIWWSLLSSCRLHKKPEVVEDAMKWIARLDPAHSSDYMLLADTNASAGRAGEAARVRDEMKRMGVVKRSPGWSCVEVGGVVHEFTVEDKGSAEVYVAVHEVMEQIKGEGYEAEATQGMAEAEGEGEKEASLAYHSEKLAMEFGIIKTGEGSTIMAYKNLRMCSDCHNAAKVMSKVFGGEIVVRDRSRFHHFKDESCSFNKFC